MTGPIELEFTVACSPEHAFWHLRQDRADATEVEIRFEPTGEATTTVRIVHRRWDRLGARGDGLRQRNERGWASLLPRYESAAAKTAPLAPGAKEGPAPPARLTFRRT